MKDRIKFVTYYYDFDEIHYSKDVGMIPYVLQEFYNFDVEIIGSRNSQNKDKKNLHNVKYTMIKKNCPIKILNVIYFFIKQSKNIDVLNLYHINIKHNFLVAFIYKQFNKKGIIYLKLDMGKRGMKMQQSIKGWRRRLNSCFLKLCDIISSETESVCDEMKKMYGMEILYIPNGWIKLGEMQENVICNKENIVMTVGNIGSYVKNTELLIRAFLNCDLCNYELYLVGPYDTKILEFLEKETCKKPEKKEKIKLIGEIKDKKKLNEYYQKCKIFVLPSRWESFGLVTVEALSNGCFCVLSDKVSPAYDLILQGNNGLIFESENEKELIDCLNKCAYLNIDYSNIIEKSNKWRWDKIIDVLYIKILECLYK